MTNPIWRLDPATDSDAPALAELRVQAMRPSLMAAGRFDATRARDRFLSGYLAADTRLVRVGGTLAGVLVLRQRPDHLYLDHLYLLEAFQGQGIGRQIVAQVQDEARALALPLRLKALNGSPANGFYLSCSFQAGQAEALDTHYHWTPNANGAPEGPA